MSEPRHLVLARSYLGTREIPGAEHNELILQWFASSGHGWIKDDETAWCAAFANAMLAAAGIRGTGSVAARSFLAWGKPLDTPEPGCLAVFWRGSPDGWQGHVGFFVGETASHVKVLGGNQKNAVSIAQYPKERLIGYRWPATLSRSRTVRGAAAAATGGLAVMAEAAGEVIDAVVSERWALASGDWIQMAVGLAIVAGALYALYARWDDAGRPNPWAR